MIEKSLVHDRRPDSISYASNMHFCLIHIVLLHVVLCFLNTFQLNIYIHFFYYFYILFTFFSDYFDLPSVQHAGHLISHLIVWKVFENI